MIEHLVRKNIRNLISYSSARDDFKGKEAVFLDANENPFGTLNRYPDPYQVPLKAKLSEIKNIPVNNIFIGNGSDEVIDLIFRIFCEPQKDKILISSPTYGMYQVMADINDVEVIDVPLNSDFQLDLEGIKDKIQTKNPKVIFLCSPNNPTGNSLDDIDAILKDFKGIVFVDEAYIDFSKRESLINKIEEYPNLVVSQTFSKARGLAGARVGLAFSGKKIIDLFNRIKSPYNVSQLNQEAALQALEQKGTFMKNLDTILSERDNLIIALHQIEAVKGVYPTDANFILIKINKATKIYNQLIDRKVVIRDRSGLIPDTLRITVGTPQENKTLIDTLKEL